MKKKILFILSIMLILMVAICQVVNALSFTVSMNAIQSTVAESTEFTVTIKVSNLDVGSNGINELKGYLDYDASVFEVVNESNIEGLNRWVPTYDAATGLISLIKSAFVSSSQEILKISFKTKAGISGTTGNINFSNIVANNSESEIQAADISTTITIGNASSTENNNNNIVANTLDNNTINVVNNNTVNNTTNNIIKNTTNNVVNNSAKNNTANNIVSNYANNVVNNAVTEVPYTGVDDTIFGCIIAVIAIALIFYIKIEKINNDLR